MHCKSIDQVISPHSQTEQPNPRLSLWSEYAHQLIAIHSGCALAWWTLTLVTLPSMRLLALVCSLASGWIVLRQCVKKIHRIGWLTLVSIPFLFLLAWQARTVTANSITDNGGMIFNPWMLFVLILASEVLALRHRRVTSPRKLFSNSRHP